MASHPFVHLMRRYVLDYLACGNTAVCPEIMVEDYLLYIGGHKLGPRDEVYVPAVAQQMEQFPGLGMMANDLICNGDRLALRFTQSGASTKHDGATAAWGGIGLYYWNGEKLTSNWALEDYYARRRQLKEGRPNALEPPHIAPWDIPIEAVNPAAEACVREWFKGETLHGTAGVDFDDEWDGHACGRLIDVKETVVDDLFSAGDSVAFHVSQSGPYVGGIGKDDRVGDTLVLRSAGIVRVADGAITGGRVIRDRGGLFA